MPSVGWRVTLDRRRCRGPHQFGVERQYVLARLPRKRKPVGSFDLLFAETQMHLQSSHSQATKEVRSKFHLSPEADMARNRGAGISHVE
jgi:hypothetical protein